MTRRLILLFMLTLGASSCGESPGALRAVRGAIEPGQEEAVQVVGDRGAGLMNDISPPPDLYGISYGSSTWVGVGCEGEGGHICRKRPRVDEEVHWERVDAGAWLCLRAASWAWNLGFIAVGDAGTILRGSDDGTSWSPELSGITADLHGVFAQDRNNVFAVGDGGVILHFDGSDWSLMQSPVTTDLYAVYAQSSDETFAEAYAVGAGGRILEYSGSIWSEMTSGVTANLHSVHGTYWPSNQFNPRFTAFAVGDGGTVLRLTGGSWKTVDARTQRDLFGVWGFDDDRIFREHAAIYAVGADGTVLELVFHE